MGMNWEQEFFRLAATVLRCRMDIENGDTNRFGCLQGQLDYGAEMHWVLKEAGMLPAQRLARCAAGLLSPTSTGCAGIRNVGAKSSTTRAY
jgi:hypothetical protein